MTRTVRADATDVRRVVKRNLPRVLACFEQHPNDASARIVVDFTIDTQGHVNNASARGGTNRALQRCVAQTFATFEFAPSRKPTRVRYPVHIVTAGP